MSNGSPQTLVATPEKNALEISLAQLREAERARAVAHNRFAQLEKSLLHPISYLKTVSKNPPDDTAAKRR